MAEILAQETNLRRKKYFTALMEKSDRKFQRALDCLKLLPEILETLEKTLELMRKSNAASRDDSEWLQEIRKKVRRESRIKNR